MHSPMTFPVARIRSLRNAQCLVQTATLRQIFRLQQYVTHVMTSFVPNVYVKLPHANVVNTHCHNRNMELFVCRAHPYTGFLRRNLMDTGALHVRNTVQMKHAEFVLLKTLRSHALYVWKNWMRTTMLHSYARSMEFAKSVTMIQILVALFVELVRNGKIRDIVS